MNSGTAKLAGPAQKATVLLRTSAEAPVTPRGTALQSPVVNHDAIASRVTMATVTTWPTPRNMHIPPAMRNNLRVIGSGSDLYGVVCMIDTVPYKMAKVQGD